MSVALTLVLPQLVGFAASRRWRRAFIWPLAAFATFCLTWYPFVWAPDSAAARMALPHPCACGMWVVVDVAILLAGLAIHFGVGSLFGLLDRHAHRAFGQATDGPNWTRASC